MIITIGREYGSNGHNVGKIIAEKLNISYYDKEIIAIAAKESGYSKELFEAADEKQTASLLFSFAMGIFPYSSKMDNIENSSFADKLFVIQKNAIEDIAKKGDCVIIGRCSDHILKSKYNTANIFICSDMENRIKQVSEKEHLSYDKAEDLIIKMDKRRANYYNYYTGGKWGRRENYDIIINSNVLGLDKTADCIINFVKLKSIQS